MRSRSATGKVRVTSSTCSVSVPSSSDGRPASRRDIAAARSSPPIGMPATLTPGMTWLAWLIAMAADAPAIASRPSSSVSRKPNRKPRRIGPGRSSTRGRAKAVSVVIGAVVVISCAGFDRPTLWRGLRCGTSTGLFPPRTPQHPAALHAPLFRAGALGGFWRLLTRLSSDDRPGHPIVHPAGCRVWLGGPPVIYSAAESPHVCRRSFHASPLEVPTWQERLAPGRARAPHRR